MLLQILLERQDIPEDAKVLIRRCIIERNHSEKDILKSIDIFQEIIDSSLSLIYIVDTEGRFILVNRKLALLLGVTQKEIVGKSRYDFLPREIADQHRKNDLEVINDKIQISFEEENVEGYGTHIYFSTKFPLINSNGNVWAVCGISTDITDSNRIKKTLSFERILLDIQLEASIDGVLIVNNEGRVVKFNGRFAELWGIPQEILATKDDALMLRYVLNSLKDPVVFLDKVKSLYRDKDEKSRDEIALVDGRFFDRYSSPLMDNEGEYLGRIWFFRDITERKRSEEEKELLQKQLFQAQKMESIGTLAGGIAHDFNNLLTVIMGNTQLAKMDSSPASNIYQSLEEIEVSSEKAVKLTQGLLAFSRKQILQQVVVDLNSVVSKFMVTIKRILGEDIIVDQNFQDGLWGVNIDPAQMDNIISNLVVNARHAMPKGGRLSIETQNVHIDEKSLPFCPEAYPGDFVMVSVADTGYGIPKKNLSKIFEPFFTTKQLGEGTGLGLSMIYGSVVQQNGFIDVKTAIGKGRTTFYIYFPAVALKGEKIVDKKTEKELVHGNETVMIVEDEEGVKAMILKILRRCGYNVVEASNAGIAFLKLNQMKAGGAEVSLVLTDVRMPEMSGPDMVKNIRAESPNIKVLFMSGYTYESDKLAGEHFISKPFTPHDLAKKIRQVLDS